MCISGEYISKLSKMKIDDTTGKCNGLTTLVVFDKGYTISE